MYKLSCHGSLALVNEGKASGAYTDGACTGGACADGAVVDRACTGGAFADKACVDRACNIFGALIGWSLCSILPEY